MYDLKELVEQTPTNRLVYLYRAILHRALCDALGIFKNSNEKRILQNLTEFSLNRSF